MKWIVSKFRLLLFSLLYTFLLAARPSAHLESAVAQRANARPNIIVT